MRSTAQPVEQLRGDTSGEYKQLSTSTFIAKRFVDVGLDVGFNRKILIY